MIPKWGSELTKKSFLVTETVQSKMELCYLARSRGWGKKEISAPLLLPQNHFRFFWVLFVYLNLVSVYFTHWNITFCLPPSVIIHFYVTRVYQNVFYFTSLKPRSIFVYLAFVLVPHDILLLT